MPAESDRDDRDLVAALERHRAALHALPGVVATGIGRSAGHRDLRIQIFVESTEHATEVEAGARAILGGIAFDVAVTGAATPGRPSD